MKFFRTFGVRELAPAEPWGGLPPESFWQACFYSEQSELLRKEIVKIRKEANLTQCDLAKLLSREQNYVTRLKLGERRLDIIELFWLCRACKVNLTKIEDRLMKRFGEGVKN